MKLVVQVKLLPTPLRAAALEATMHACNEAATWVSGVAFERGVNNNFALRRLTYGEIKAGWNLGAQAARHVIKKTCDAYAALKANLKAGRCGRLHALLGRHRPEQSEAGPAASAPQNP